MNESIKITLVPSTYLTDLTFNNQTACTLSINASTSSTVTNYILGGLFLKDYYTIFNQENSTIGFIGIQDKLDYLGNDEPPLSSGIVIALIIIVSVAAVILIVGISCFVRKNNSN